MITVILADDHAVLRDGLRFLLEAEGDMEIVATAANGQEAVEQATVWRPDVVMMDISMPVMNGIEATKRICATRENTKVVILSMYHTNDYVQRALDAGAAGYLMKDSAGTELIAVIRALHAGKPYFNQRTTKS
ncbi:MAG: response regulator [Anaerolineales bacterium]